MYNGIAIAGKICTGKTLLARHLAEKYGWQVHGLAAALKEDVVEALYMAGLGRDKSGIMNMKGQLRALYQEWGRLFREVNGEDWWVDRLFKQAGKQPFVCDDLRYPNELEAFRRRGFLLVRLQVDPQDQLNRVERLYPDMRLEQLRHPSETALDGAWKEFDLIAPMSADTPDKLFAWWDVYGAPRFPFNGGKED